MSGGGEEFHTWPSVIHYEMWVRFCALISNHCSRTWSDMYVLFNLILYMCRLMVYTGWWMGTTLGLSTLVTQVLLSHLVNTKAFCRFLECAISYIPSFQGCYLSCQNYLFHPRFLGRGAGSVGSPVFKGATIYPVMRSLLGKCENTLCSLQSVNLSGWMWGICHGCRRIHHARTCTKSARGKIPILHTQFSNSEVGNYKKLLRSSSHSSHEP